ncbi:MAG: ParB/RepB/Spo0J family partition protein, partial [Burkholderiales bacterium]
MARIKGLGRGLDALLGVDEPAAGGETLASVAIDALQPGRFQPRARIGQEGLAELAESIKAQGVMQPILVRPIGAGRYEIVAGERRWRAARMAGLS